MSVVLIVIAWTFLMFADIIAFGTVRERWIQRYEKRTKFPRDTYQSHDAWMRSQQRQIARRVLGGLWCYYRRPQAEL